MSFASMVGTTLIAAMFLAVAPRVLVVSSENPAQNRDLADFVTEVRSKADAFVFLSGGASRMAPDKQRQLLGMFDALAAVAKDRRLAVGDGGTKTGIMEAAGSARHKSGDAFLLVGVAPAGEIPPQGTTDVDPNHSHIIAVRNPAAPPKDAWGSETDTMYWLFGKLAEGRPSVTVVANGGGVTLREIEANVRARRQMIVIEGSGRAADAIVSLLTTTAPTEAEVLDLRARAEKAGLPGDPSLYRRITLASGSAGLGAAIAAALGSPQ